MRVVPHDEGSSPQSRNESAMRAALSVLVPARHNGGEETPVAGLGRSRIQG